MRLYVRFTQLMLLAGLAAAACGGWKWEGLPLH
jgi:hypothetical protein